MSVGCQGRVNSLNPIYYYTFLRCITGNSIFLSKGLSSSFVCKQRSNGGVSFGRYIYETDKKMGLSGRVGTSKEKTPPRLSLSHTCIIISYPYIQSHLFNTIHVYALRHSEKFVQFERVCMYVYVYVSVCICVCVFTLNQYFHT